MTDDGPKTRETISETPAGCTILFPCIPYPPLQFPMPILPAQLVTGKTDRDGIQKRSSADNVVPENDR